MSKLTYFGIRGRAETPRLILELSGENYTNETVTFETWGNIRTNFPFCEVPFYEDGDVKIAQSLAILRHVARKHNLYGKNLKEQALVDSYIDASNDLVDYIFKSLDKFKAGETEEFRNKITTRLGQFAKILSDNGSGFFVGDSVTAADVAFFTVIDNYVKPIAKDLVEGNAEIEAHRARFAAIPNIAAYLKSDRRPVLTLPPNFGILCTPEQCA